MANQVHSRILSLKTARLITEAMKIIQAPSPNFGKRVDGAVPSILVLHYTGMRTGEEALARMCDPLSQVSAHYMVEEDGRIFQLVEEGRRAWHAGKSYWGGKRDINSYSIGVEIVNPGHELGYHAFPQGQMEAVISLSKEIVERHNISPARILAHSDIAPSRKSDPGELFLWKDLARHGIGLWPDLSEMDKQAGADLISDSPDIFHELLCTLGYDPMAEFGDVVTAFHRRYCPEKFNMGVDFCALDEHSAACLLALFRAVHACKA